MTLDETKEKLTDVSMRFNTKVHMWLKIEMKWYIYDNKLNNVSEFNLIHDRINPPKRAKNINIHYSPIIHGCIIIRRGRAKLKNLRILLNSVCSFTIVIIRLVEKLILEKYTVMQWHTQAENITTNLNIKVDFTLTALSSTNIVTWKCCVYDSAKGRYDMILCRYLWT